MTYARTMVELAERRQGYDVKIYDAHVALSK